MVRTVITGFGIKAPGIENETQFQEVLENGICTLESLEGKGPNDSSIVAGVVHNDFSDILGKHFKRIPRISRLAIASAVDAVQMADIPNLQSRRVGIVIGTSVGCTDELEVSAFHSKANDYRRFPTLTAGLSNTHSLASAVSSHLQVQGPSFTLGTGCTGASDAFLFGKMLLETGQIDVCIAGGADAPINGICIYGFAKLNSLCVDVPVEKAGVPFSTEQEGFVMSEGAGIVILEREEDALSRGAKVYGVLEKVSANNDAVSIHQSDDTGQSMLRALREVTANQTPTYVSSQALGLRINDMNDSIAHQTLFQNQIPITSIKGHLGHTMGAAGAIQTIEALLAMKHGYIPSTIRTTGKGYEDLPIVYETRRCQVTSVAITTHGYGGNNGCVLITKFDR